MKQLLSNKYSVINIKSEEDTLRLATELSSFLTGGLSIGLSGDLGSGKTSFTRYLLKEMGALSDVSSPTYVLQNVYEMENQLVCEHWDLYRLSSLPEELFEPPKENCIRIIEWPEKVDELVEYLDIHITFTNPYDEAAPEKRIVSVKR